MLLALHVIPFFCPLGLLAGKTATTSVSKAIFADNIWLVLLSWTKVCRCFLLLLWTYQHQQCCCCCWCLGMVKRKSSSHPPPLSSTFFFFLKFCNHLRSWPLCCVATAVTIHNAHIEATTKLISPRKWLEQSRRS